MTQLSAQLLLWTTVALAMENIQSLIQIRASPAAREGVPIAQQGGEITAKIRTALTLGLQHQ